MKPCGIWDEPISLDFHEDGSFVSVSIWLKDEEYTQPNTQSPTKSNLLALPLDETKMIEKVEFRFEGAYFRCIFQPKIQLLRDEMSQF